MEVVDFFTLKINDTVIVVNEDWGMKGGWTDDMSEMLNIPLNICRLHKSGKAVDLMHPKTGRTYRFMYTTIIKESDYRFDIVLKNRVYKCKHIIDIYRFGDHLSEQGYATILKVANKITKNRFVPITSDTVREFIQAHPQSMATMLYTNILMR